MTTLSNSEEVIRRLYQITNDYNKGFEYQINALLRMGLERFGLDIGILSRIEQDIYTVKYCVTPTDIPIQPGDQFDFNNTYCKITCSAGGPVACEYIGKDDELGSHPAYKSLGLESYIGIPLHIGAELYGTLNFSSPAPYPRKFRDIDIDALQFMASWIEVELIRREQEKQLKSLNQKLELQAHNDSLTNIPNRRGMFRHLHKELNLLTRSHGKGALAIIDIDYFKKVNDIHGHQKGDEVLVAISHKITGSIRDYDYVARIGGEEFLLLLPDTDQEGCAVVCNIIMQNIAMISLIPEPLTVSIGAYHFHFENEPADEITTLIDSLIAKADKALYQAKAQGRNRLVNYIEPVSAP